MDCARFDQYRDYVADVARDPSFLAAAITAGGGEESITQFLAGLLHDKELLAAYLSAVLPEANALPLDAVVRAEDEDGSEKGVPDISITVDSRLRLLVENKLGAPFTDNQPHEYVKTLATWKRENPAGVAALVLHAPEGRLPHLLGETSARMGSRAAALPQEGESYGGVLVRAMGWSAMERLLASHLATVTDPVFEFLLRSFLYLLRPSAQAVAKPLTKDHIMHLTNRAVLEAITAAEDLLRDVRALLNRSHKSEIKCEMDGQGVAVWPKNADGKPDKAKEFYVGLYARVAARFGTSPFIVQLTGDDYVNIEAVRASGRRVVEGAELQVFDWVERPIVPIDLLADLDPPEQAKRVANEIEAVRTIALGKTHRP